MNGYHCVWWSLTPTATAVHNIISPLSPWLVHALWPWCVFSFCRLLINDLDCLIHKKWCSSAWRWCIMNGGLSVENDISFFFFSKFSIHVFFIARNAIAKFEKLSQGIQSSSKARMDITPFLLKYQYKIKIFNSGALKMNGFFLGKKLTENVPKLSATSCGFQRTISEVISLSPKYGNSSI